MLDKRDGFRNHSFAFADIGARREDVLKREQVRLPIENPMCRDVDRFQPPYDVRTLRVARMGAE